MSCRKPQVKGIRWHDKLYGVLFDADCHVLYYRKDVFDIRSIRKSASQRAAGLNLGFQPIGSRIMRAASMGEWFCPGGTARS
jgi:hypothetical protein